MSRTQTWRRRWTGMAVVAAVVVVAAAAMAGRSVEAGATPEPTLPDGGYLHLHFGADGNRFEHGTVETEPIRAPGECKAVIGGQMGDADLVEVQPTPSTGFVGTETAGNTVIGLGVRPAQGPGTSGANCGYINRSEGLTLKLGTDLSGYIADSAELDFDAKYSVHVFAALYLKGEPVLDELGDPVVIDKQTGGSDSGPDSTSKDNDFLVIEGYFFDEIRLSGDGPSNKATFALEGGREGDPRAPGGLRENLGTYDTVFHLIEADGILCETDTVTVLGRSGNEEPDKAVLTRDEDGSGQCVPYQLNLGFEDGNQFVEFLKDLTTAPSATFTLEITWSPTPATYPTSSLTSIDFDGDGGDPAQLAQWCDPGPAIPSASVPWCLIARSETLQNDIGSAGSPLMQEVETFFGYQDPKIFR